MSLGHAGRLSLQQSRCLLRAPARLPLWLVSHACGTLVGFAIELSSFTPDERVRAESWWDVLDWFERTCKLTLYKDRPQPHVISTHVRFRPLHFTSLQTAHPGQQTVKARETPGRPPVTCVTSGTTREGQRTGRASGWLLQETHRLFELPTYESVRITHGETPLPQAPEIYSSLAARC